MLENQLERFEMVMKNFNPSIVKKSSSPIDVSILMSGEEAVGVYEIIGKQGHEIMFTVSLLFRPIPQYSLVFEKKSFEEQVDSYCTMATDFKKGEVNKAAHKLYTQICFHPSIKALGVEEERVEPFTDYLFKFQRKCSFL